MMRFGKIMADARFLQCLTSGLNFSQPSDALFIVIFANAIILSKNLQRKIINDKSEKS